MIKITLEFNTWEEAVAYMPKGEKAVGDLKSVATKTEAASPKPTPQKVEKPAAGTSAPAADAAQPASSNVDYTTLQKAVFTLAGKSREAAAEVASSFGVKTFKELDADKWGAALEAVNAKLSELEAA